MKDIKLGFIGFGNMGGALAKGLVEVAGFPSKNIFACAKNQAKLENNCRALGIMACNSVGELIASVDMVIIAIKPFMIESVLTPHLKALKEKTIISLAAGYPFERYEGLLLQGTRHLSTVPNTPVAIGKGIFICEENHNLTEEEITTFQEIFAPIGLIQFLPTSQLSIGAAIAGCGPAFASMFIEALGDGGVLHGLSRDVAYRLASQMLVGTGGLQLSTGKNPGAMKDEVCSPKGTTIVGVKTLEKYGFRSAIIEALDSIERK